jgi:formamidopyrimidine-DNA glycosylase
VPELPEVEHARRQLTAWGEGAVLTGVVLADPAAVREGLTSRPSDAVADPLATLAPLVGRVAGAPVRHGKRLGWPFGDAWLLAHLGMSGKWVRRSPEDPAPPAGRIGFEVTRGGERATLWLVDTRRFGCVSVGTEEDLHRGLGPDALLAPPTGAELAALLDTKRPIKLVLLEQDRVAGLGNIHAAEALWRARIHPDRACATLSAAEWDRLASAIGAQLAEAIGSFDGVDEVVYLSEGREESPFAVYGRAGEPCRTCGAPVVREVRGQRGTWWCPVCQPAT